MNTIAPGGCPRCENGEWVIRSMAIVIVPASIDTESIVCNETRIDFRKLLGSQLC